MVNNIFTRKFLILIFTLLFILISVIDSQAGRRRRFPYWTIGAKYGANHSTYGAIGKYKSVDMYYANTFPALSSFNHVADFKKLGTEKLFIGMEFGGTFDFVFTKEFSMTAELLYSQNGAHVLGKAVLYPYQVDLKMRRNYLNVPVIFNVNFGDERLSTYLSAGFYIGRWMSGWNKLVEYFEGGLTSTGQIMDEWTNEVLKTKYVWTSPTTVDYQLASFYEFNPIRLTSFKHLEHRFDFGILLAGGLLIEAGPGSIQIDFRIREGIIDIYKYEDMISTYTPKYNRVMSISVGYKLSI